MRSSALRNAFITPGLKLTRGRGVQEDAVRRRWVVIAAAMGLAMAGGVAGMSLTPSEETTATTGPFSYFPSE